MTSIWRKFNSDKTEELMRRTSGLVSPEPVSISKFHTGYCKYNCCQYFAPSFLHYVIYVEMYGFSQDKQKRQQLAVVPLVGISEFFLWNNRITLSWWCCKSLLNSIFQNHSETFEIRVLRLNNPLWSRPRSGYPLASWRGQNQTTFLHTLSTTGIVYNFPDRSTFQKT